MLNRILVVGLGSCLLFACGSGGPKGALDRALGKHKKEKPFVADVSSLKGAYTLRDIKKSHGSSTSYFAVEPVLGIKNSDPDITLYFRDNGVEIASKTEAPIKTCSILQAISQGPSNNLEIAPSEGCSSLSLEIVEQFGNSFTAKLDPFACPGVNNGMCDGLRFERRGDQSVGWRMFTWSPESIAKMPPTIKSLQYQDVVTSDLEAARAKFRKELLSASVSLNEDLTLNWFVGQSDGYGAIIANGKVITRDEINANIENGAPRYGETQCIVSSKTQKTLPKFQRKLAKLEVSHINRTEGMWIYDQLHEGLDTLLPPEQRRTPTESKLPTTRAKNTVTLTVESADSEQNGNGIKSDRDLSILCDKAIAEGPIQIEDVQKALGSVVVFRK